MGQAVQIAGALAVLAAFAAAQAGVVDQRSRRYLVPNLVGSAMLAVDAFLNRQWGFLILEGAWAAVSAWSLAVRGRRRPAGC
jgi:hypothetical protein